MTILRFRTAHTLAALLGLLLISGCPFGGGEGEGGGDEAVDTTDAPTEAAEEDLLEEREAYDYNSTGKRDPFRSFVQKEVVVGPSGGPVGPLQVHPIDSYTLVGAGSSAGAGGSWALVETPDGVGWVVELGTLIGRNWGKVTEITESNITITEEWRDPIENDLIIHEVKMSLAELGQGQ